MSVVGSSRGFRPANNGRRYDWYIRICRHDDSKPTRDELLKALGPLVRKSVIPTRQDVELLQRKIDSHGSGEQADGGSG